MKTLLIAAALAATPLQEGAPRTPGPPTNAQFAAARQVLDDRLLDFPAARFRNVRANDFMICGQFNAKNRMGAYNGWKAFGISYLDGEADLYAEGGSSSDELMLGTLCANSNRFDGPDYSDRLRHR